MLNIRKFQPTDTFAVIKIASDSLPEIYNPSIFNYFYESHPQGFIVAEKNHSIVGFIVGIKPQHHSARILMLAVSKLHRKNGIGEKLLKSFLQEMVNENIMNIELEVRMDNENAVNFYLKNGFKIIEKVSGFYQNGEDAYLLKLNR